MLLLICAAVEPGSRRSFRFGPRPVSHERLWYLPHCPVVAILSWGCAIPMGASPCYVPPRGRWPSIIVLQFAYKLHHCSRLALCFSVGSARHVVFLDVGFFVSNIMNSCTNRGKLEQAASRLFFQLNELVSLLASDPHPALPLGILLWLERWA